MIHDAFWMVLVFSNGPATAITANNHQYGNANNTLEQMNTIATCRPNQQRGIKSKLCKDHQVLNCIKLRQSR